jgi:hypothetical protein
MSTERQSPSARPQTWLLVLLGLSIVALLATRVLTNWVPAQSTSSTPTRTSSRARGQAIDPKELDIRLEALEAARPDQGEVARNPFRFYQKPQPTPSPGSTGPLKPVDPGPPQPPPPPPIPPIPWKLMGFVEIKPGERVAALSDCKGGTWNARQGEIVDGQYRVVQIGIESIIIEYLDGKGRQPLRLEGCPPR